MEVPPGEPTAATNLPWRSSTMAGDIDERGRLPPAAALAAGRAVAVGGREGEVGELVVEEEAVDHPAVAEDALHRGGHGDHVAGGVDDDEVGGAAGLDGAVGARGRAAPGGSPGRAADRRSRPISLARAAT